MSDQSSDRPDANIRTANGRFAKGNPGGPGRPRHAVTDAVEAAQELIEVAIKEARKGNMTALKLVLDRGWPVHHRRPIAIDAPALVRSDDFLPAQAALTDAVLDGEVEPREGAVIASLLEEQRQRVRLLEIQEERERARQEDAGDEAEDGG
jgi:hypothetical protein